MTQRTLACSVSASVYDQFRALLPDGADVNRQLCALVDAFIAGAPAEVDMEALKARWLAEHAGAKPVILPPEQPDTAPMAVYDPDRPLQEQIDALEPGTELYVQVPDADLVAINAIVHSTPVGNGVMTTRTLADPTLCLHPHESLVRDGRFVRCTLCDRIIR